METHDVVVDVRAPLIVLLVGLYIYDDIILGSLSIVGGFIPLPHIRFDEFLYIFILYYLVTRYKLIDEWLKRAAGKGDAPKAPIQPMPEKEMKAEFNASQTV